MNESKCIVCKLDITNDGRGLQDKAKRTILDASIQRKDNLLDSEVMNNDVYVHTNCYKSYTRKENIIKSLKAPTRNDDGDESSPRPLRRLFDYKTHCLVCAEELKLDDLKRHPDRKDWSEVEVMDKSRKCLMQEKLLKACGDRTDQQSLSVKAHIDSVGDIRAVEAKYHRKCMQS